MEHIFKKIDKLVIFFAAYTFIFMVFFGTLGYTLPFVLAFILALFLKIPTAYLMKKLKVKSTVASLFTTTVFFTIIVTLLTLT